MYYMIVNRATEGVVAEGSDKDVIYGRCRSLNGRHGRQYVVRSYFTNTLGV